MRRPILSGDMSSGEQVHGAGQYLVLGAKASAILDGRPHVTGDDIRRVALPVLRHRNSDQFSLRKQKGSPPTTSSRSCWKKRRRMSSEEAQRLLDPASLAKVAGLVVRARMIVEGSITGLHRSPFHGSSVEFAEHREYVAGDDIRHIDWKVFGRSDRFYIKQFEEETNLRVQLVLDASESMTLRLGSDDQVGLRQNTRGFSRLLDSWSAGCCRCARLR